jgi:murein DD-endopeptidase MepM/ murein hydrolase activator NlpD
VRALCVFSCALVFVPSAFARTDGGRQLAFAWPADGVVTSPYGWDNGRWHSGIDIGILRSLGVLAAESGFVTTVGTPTGYEGYGTLVDVQVSERYSNVYAHLSRPVVLPGQYVVAGQALGVAGCTGWCTGTHLHFELRDRGRPIDPTNLMTGYNRPFQGG